ncbi:MAG: type II toxin-antitoxin system PemK/MazF family toxin [Bryobacteraceae bacterium]
MKRGELYLVRKPGSQDPRRQRVFVIVSRQALIDSRFSSLICAPVYSRHDGLSTQVRAGPDEGLKRESSIHCDELVSLPKSALAHYVGSLSAATLRELDRALAVSVGLDSFEPLGF